MPSNEDRARRAGRALSFYDDDDNWSAVVDLLTDLRHFSYSVGLDFDDCNRIAGVHFEAETGGEE